MMSFREQDYEPVGIIKMFKTYFDLSEKCIFCVMCPFV